MFKLEIDVFEEVGFMEVAPFNLIPVLGAAYHKWSLDSKDALAI